MAGRVKIKCLIGTGTAGRSLALSNQGVDYLVRSGKLSYIIIDGRKFYDSREVQKLADERRVGQ